MSEHTFFGYARPDGGVGVRNHPLVMATCDCAYEEAKRIAAAIPGAVCVGQFHGCGADPMIVRQLVGVAANPNVGAVLLVGLGCESITAELLGEGIRQRRPRLPLADVVIQRDGGSLRAIERGSRILRDMAAELAPQARQPFEIANLTVALQCGGSDVTSAMAANPALGMAVDRLVDAGATVIFSETVELSGTAHLLARRAATPAVAARIAAIIDDEVRRRRITGQPGRPLPQGNHDGGLTTIEEKALGNIMKSGSRPIQDVLEHSAQRLQRPAGPGLYLMDGTAWDVPSITQMVAVGAQVAVFTTGRGSTTGHAIVPVIKVTGNPSTYAHMADNMDVNAALIISGEASIAAVGDEIYKLVVRVASGQMPLAEALGFHDFQMFTRHPAVERLIRPCD